MISGNIVQMEFCTEYVCVCNAGEGHRGREELRVSAVET